MRTTGSTSTFTQNNRNGKSPLLPSFQLMMPRPPALRPDTTKAMRPSLQIPRKTPMRTIAISQLAVLLKMKTLS